MFRVDVPLETFVQVDPRSRSKINVKQARHVVPGQPLVSKGLLRGIKSTHCTHCLEKS